MTNYTLPKNHQPQPDRSSDWYNRFHIYLSSGPSRTLKSAFHASTGSKSTPSATAGNQAAKWHWEERVMACDRAIRHQNAQNSAPKNPKTTRHL